jgi:hypothetical protein
LNEKKRRRGRTGGGRNRKEKTSDIGGMYIFKKWFVPM